MKRQTVTNAHAAEVANRTQDAYSFERYGKGAWTMCAKRLAQRGCSLREIEAILRSKWMRWAGDASNKSYNVTSQDLLRWMDQNTTPEEIVKLTAETFGS